MELHHLFKDKRFWFSSILIAWAAGLQGHMMWLQRQDNFKKKFGEQNQNVDEDNDNDNQVKDKKEEKVTFDF
ncbi:hypothetical protein C5167_000226 [Papaver somniferum]|uniref:Transmembrane protein n=1 Tax=Papaver somniferum TaxID=3469 RepID=A0A4Y7KVG9_PAPSO|nr:uncharacterized protein LOC113308551 [Papaver somniferum]XP_026412801.1 uncharacterized protein LOC113308551 [Papaver somniferum]RZC76111.1 hypothetical protein C5167_000226 [Papaver somniferum]